ncbi:MAG: SDR family oxidoreductase [Dehalococcoidia bacterium]|jgi:NAD(P)-dependent dehydrogenase (short-subunit alcohol dehydrogenase family)|nr:SDR family oxidoreductase [Dehalococcoidia bacterium]
MTNNTENRTAFVSGGSRGIGKAIALGLAQSGSDVAINYTRDKEAAEETIAEIQALGKIGKAYQGNVADFEDCQRMVNSALNDLGEISILINNAGVASRGSLITDTSPEEIRKVVGVHVFGTHNLCHLLVPQMREAERGDVIMISSVATESLSGRGAPYNMAKSAQEAIAFTLAKEERVHGIRVNIVGPGLVETDMGKRLVKATRGVENIRELDEGSPFARVCQPEDIADAVVFFCSEDAAYVTGQRLYVNGGSF